MKNTLPPSLSGFPGEAEIRYFVKVTVQRPQFYKENRRAVWAYDLGRTPADERQFADFKFFPIEPPRPPSSKQEAYARRQHEFAPSGQPRKRSMFETSRKADGLPFEREPGRFRVDARLPNPAIITCNEPLPLRVLIQKQSGSSERPILQSIQIELIGYTHIRAHDLNRVEGSTWVVLSHSNMSIPLGDPNAPAGTELKIDDKLWKNILLPNTVAPSFTTCNMRRRYELEVRVGLGYGSAGNIRVALPSRHSTQNQLMGRKKG